MDSMKYPWIVAACFVAGLGCNSSPADGTQVEAPRPTTAVEGGPELGLTIDLPDDWVIVDLTQPDWRQSLRKQIAANPAVAKIEPLIPLRPSESPKKLVAFDILNEGNGFTDNMNIVVLPVPDSITLDMLIAANIEQMEGIQAKGTSFATKKISLDGQDAGLVTWGMMNKKNTITMRTYFVLRKGKYFTITFSCLAQRKADYLKQVEKAMASVRFTAQP